jgi:hypothetical protein
MFDNSLKIGTLDAFHLVNIAKEFYATMTEEDFKAIFESGGMDGKKYRANLFKTVIAATAQHKATEWATASDEKKSFMVTLNLAMMGAFFGTTPAKRVLVKNMGGHMDNRTTKNDVMALAWKSIETHFGTYVNGDIPGKFPSLKFQSCAADFALFGLCLVFSKLNTVEEIRASFLDVNGAVKNFNDWPDHFRKQSIGNLDLNTAMQNEHKAWEDSFWDEQVTTTRNESNKTFKEDREKESGARYYSTTVTDNIQLWSHTFTRVTPSSGKYTKTEIANYIMALCSKMKHDTATATDPANTAWTAFATHGVGANVSTTTTSQTVDNYISSLTGVAMGRVGHANLVTP